MFIKECSIELNGIRWYHLRFNLNVIRNTVSLMIILYHMFGQSERIQYMQKAIAFSLYF